MAILIMFFYAAVLFVGLVGSWVVDGRRNVLGYARIQWWIVLFPMVLVLTILLKPQGPDEWIFRLPEPSIIDWVVLLVVLILVSVRGLWEIIHTTLDWTRLLNRSVSGQVLQDAPWLDYQAMVKRVGLSKVPEIRFHRDIKTPFVCGWSEPRIVFPASLVPIELRNEDTFWFEADFIGEDPKRIQIRILHELTHVKAWDHLRLAILALNALLIPWEWIVGRTDLDKSVMTGNRAFRTISKIFKVVGYPYSMGLEAEREAQEHHAQLGADEWERMRSSNGQGGVKPPGRRFGVLEAWRETVFTIVCLSILTIAPGISVLRFAVQGDLTTLNPLPTTWSLKVEPGFGKATAGVLPGGNDSGKIIVDVGRVIPWHWPQLKAAGRIEPSRLPDKGWIDMTWEMTSEDNKPLPLAVHLQLSEVPIVETTDQDAWMMRADPTEGVAIGPHRYRFHRRIRYGDIKPKPTWLYIDYYFQDKGRWIFDPPKLLFISENGDRLSLS